MVCVKSQHAGLLFRLLSEHLSRMFQAADLVYMK